MTDNFAASAWYISGPTDDESQKIINRLLQALQDLTGKSLNIQQINSETELRSSLEQVRQNSLPRPSVLLFGEQLPDSFSSKGGPMFEEEVLKIIINRLPKGERLFVVPFSINIELNTERFNTRKIYEIGDTTKWIGALGINPLRVLTHPGAEERRRKFEEELVTVQMMSPKFGRERR